MKEKKVYMTYYHTFRGYMKHKYYRMKTHILDWGSRGREFKSPHSDIDYQSLMSI